METVKQPSLVPTRKVASAAAFGMPAGIVISWLIESFLQVDVPAPVASAMGSMLSVAFSYFVKEWDHGSD